MADIQEIIDKLGTYHFECEAGPLGLCADWLKLLVSIYILQDRVIELETAYYKLILAVSNKWPNETRHQTALRYIQEHENTVSGPAQQSKEVV